MAVALTEGMGNWLSWKSNAAALIFLGLAVGEAGANCNNPLAGPTARWTAHVREMDEALGRQNVGGAERAWQTAYLAALLRARQQGSRNGVLRAGEAVTAVSEPPRALRIGDPAVP